jgi:hypothetical protein
MSQRTYKYGKHTCKAYKKPAGKGFEVGITMGGHPVFVGNFIRAKECNTWWTTMNKEMFKFSKKYSAASHAPPAWTSKFLSNYMYKCYYSYLDKEFSKYNRGYAQAVRKDEQRHSVFKRNMPPQHHAFKAYTMRRSA